MGTLEVSLFGTPKLVLNDELVDPGRRRVMALSAYLAANDTPQPRDGICTILWPERSPGTARAELRRTISALRACVGSSFVEATRSTVALSPEVFVDVREFKTLLESTRIHQHGTGALCPDCIRALERASSLYTGDFLSGFSLSDSRAFDDWMIFEEERLRDLFGDVLERLSRPVAPTAGEGPRDASPLDYAHRWLRLDDLNEAAHCRLMTLYARAGQRSAALRQYATCERLLRQELGASPSAAAVELKHKIESGRPDPDSPVRVESVEARAGRSKARPEGARKRTARRRTAAILIMAAHIAASLGLLYALWSASHHETSAITVAVLPLVDNSSDAHNQWFADGMTEAIITDLARIRALRVTSRSSAEVIAQDEASIPEIRRRLGVDYVVEGSVLRAADRVRITAQLIDARSDKHVWADEYEADLTNIIGLQGRIADNIATQVSARLSSTEKSSLTQSRPVDPRAYEAYLLGGYELARLPFDVNNAPKALADLKRSIAMDGAYAPAHAALANYYWGSTQFGLYSNEEGLKLAETEAERAVALDDNLSEAHTVLGFVRFLYDFDWQGAEREFRRAISLKPSSAQAHCWYGSLLCTLGRFDDAIAEVKKARDIDPLSLVNILNVAMRLYYARDYDEAIGEAEIARKMENQFYMSHMVLGYAFAAKGSFNQAIDELETAATLAGDGAMEPLAVLAYVYSRAGRADDARRAELRFDELGKKGMVLSPLLRSYIPLGRGDYDAALSLIERAYAERDLNLAWNFQDPFFDPLRRLPRFQRLQHEMKL